ncbi:MAG: phage adsorption protein NrfB, partial [Clostridiales bacterium]|nr:phage adsorption protein NrfB [Clostridiales bacterium]
MVNAVLYIIGFIIALTYILFSFDDFIWDIVNLFSFKRPEHLKIERIDFKPPRLLAIMVAAWHEESVLEPVIDNMVDAIHYPRSMYHIFLGVYPNDNATIAVARRLEEKYENVHMVVNVRPGPTCKADNVNNIIRCIREFEEERGWKFTSVTVHDSEDVIHPYELKVTNYLIDDYDSLQFPVFPLQRKPTLNNFFSNMTSGTYADEFAENHYRVMGTRDSMSAFVPSAGTGFAISSRILDSFRGKQMFPEDSLTEDYKLSLIFAELGYKTHYVLEKVQRLTDDGKLKWDYIATRSIFPGTYQTAVKQKTRWIYGITMQSAKFGDIFKPSKVTAAGRYTLYKDQKAKIGNLLILPGYMVFAYAIASIFIDLPVIYPMFSPSWWLCVALTAMMIFRQGMRAVAIANVYGLRSALLSCYLPPLMPIRLIWGNIINTSATFRAWKQLWFGIKKYSGVKKKVAWAKTDHEFISKQVLFRYHRNTGDVLLEKKYVDFKMLKEALAIAQNSGMRLGDVLLENNVIMEHQLIDAVAASRHITYVDSLEPYNNRLLKNFDTSLLLSNHICPILRMKNGKYVYAVTNYTPDEVVRKVLAAGNKIVYTAKTEVVLFLVKVSQSGCMLYNIVADKVASGRMDWEHAVLALE